MEKYSKFIWSSEFSIGNNVIDSEHIELMEIYNDLCDIALTGNKLQDLAKILSKMTDYALWHFKKEECYMEQMGYPGYNVHLSAHKDYIYKVTMYNVSLLRNDPPDSAEILEFIKKWWSRHIVSVDQAYEDYKRKKNIDIEYSQI
jgi:hemerythrin-like metal-binding protein